MSPGLIIPERGSNRRRENFTNEFKLDNRNVNFFLYDALIAMR